MGPESLCFLFFPEGQPAGDWEEAEPGAMPGAGVWAELQQGQLVLPHPLSGTGG